MPHALLCVTRLWTSVSNRPPAMTMPVPTGPAAADPASGTLGSLLSCTKLLRQISHEDVPVGPLPDGHEPSCGDGASSLFCELVTMPVALSSHRPFWMMRCAPELVPE